MSGPEETQGGLGWAGDVHAELLRKIDELSVLRRLADQLAGAVDLAALAGELVSLVRDEIGADVVVLWGVATSGAGLVLRAASGPEGEGAAPEAGPGIVPPGSLAPALAGSTIHLADLGASDAAALPPPLDSALRSLLCFPLTSRGRVTGILALGSQRPAAFGPEDERLLAIIAPAAAMALENAELCASLKEARDNLAEENTHLRRQLGERFGPRALVGQSPAFRRVLAALERLAAVEVTVLILGASGTGKELVARALHHASSRRDRPFVALNCAALPESLLEAELFGVEKGVATGVDRRAGLIEQAEGGTLFLDEIGDMSPGVQAKILRVLQEREVVRVGGGRPRPVHFRLVAATNQNLERAVREGRFREDLYFRLKVAVLQLPPLAERREDIALLAGHFLTRLASRYGRRELRLTSAALAYLSAREWPGNVRELENTIEQAVVMAAGPAITPADLGAGRGLGRAPLPEGGRGLRTAVAEVSAAAEREMIERALAAAGNNRTRAARLLGIGRRTLLYKLKDLGIGC